MLVTLASGDAKVRRPGVYMGQSHVSLLTHEGIIAIWKPTVASEAVS